MSHSQQPIIDTVVEVMPERPEIRGLVMQDVQVEPVMVRLRMPDGTIQNCALFIGKDKTLEYVSNPELLHKWIALRSAARPAGAPGNVVRGSQQRGPVEVPGIKFRVEADGTRVIESVDEITQHAMQFFRQEIPCFFEGCAEMRAKLLKDMHRIEESNGKCTECDFRDLQRVYLPQVIDKLKLAGWQPDVVKPAHGS